MKKYWKKLPKWGKIIAWIFLFLMISEIVLRYLVGLGDLAIYREDSDYEYFYESNQSVWRYGNHIETNEFGMRSKKVSKKKKMTILEFGDSVLNGGSHVDQDDLSTTLQEIELNKTYGDNIQILNISAQSWGLSNAFSFLKKEGNFNTGMIVLVFSSHDLNDNMHFRKVVGNHPAWPNEKPLLAIMDAWTRYIWPKTVNFFTGANEYDYLQGFDDSKVNPGWKNFFEYGKEKNIPILVYLHATQKEMADKKYDPRGNRIIKICSDNNIELIQDINFMDADAYIDDIHLNGKGHKIMTDLLLPVLKKQISNLLISSNSRN